MKLKSLLSGVIIIASLAVSSCSNQHDPIYKNHKYSIEERTKDLLSRMTVEEKVAQTLAIWRKMGAEGKFSTSGQAFDPQYGLGAIHRRYTNISMSEGAEESNAIQKYFIENTRLGIPVIINGEGLHGIVANEATIFPQAIALASTWDPELFGEIFSSVALQARALGIHEVFSPNLDIIRDPRYGRVQENYSEDPYLATELGVACINGLQGNKVTLDSIHVAATIKHFAVSSQNEGGLNKSPGNVSERTIREVFFPPFKAAVEKCNSRFIMISYNEVDGLPSHANKWLLQGVLRNEWNYKGITISDHNALNQLVKYHSVSANKKEAALKALSSGIDMDLSSDTLTYLTLPDQINQRKISESLLDAAVERVLRLKFELGLFDHPLVDPDKTRYVINTEEDRALALKAAQEAVILLKNENQLLPLNKDKIKRVAVIGPNAMECQFGEYSGNTTTGISLLEGIKRKIGNEKVMFAKGCEISFEAVNEYLSAGELMNDEMRKSINEAAKVAGKCDIAVLALGENNDLCGEGKDVNDLELAGLQNELVKAIVATGKPVIVVMINGRPLSMKYVAKNANAILEGWYLGQSQGDALADIIFGDVNPSGKLTVSIPSSVGNLPCYYNKKPSLDKSKYIFSDNKPLFPFGFGLSYTTFEYKNLKVERETIAPAENTKVTVEVTNTGKMKGDEIVQLYIHDLVSSVTRPVKELKGFKRISLSPGETRVVEFEITPEKLSFYNERMELVVEPGSFSIMVGPSSTLLSTVCITVTD